MLIVSNTRRRNGSLLVSCLALCPLLATSHNTSCNTIWAADPAIIEESSHRVWRRRQRRLWCVAIRPNDGGGGDGETGEREAGKAGSELREEEDAEKRGEWVMVAASKRGGGRQGEKLASSSNRVQYYTTVNSRSSRLFHACVSLIMDAHRGKCVLGKPLIDYRDSSL